MTKILIFCCVLITYAGGAAVAQEQLDLSSPVVRADISSYRVGAICLDWQAARIDIRLFDPVTGETARQNPVTGERFEYTGQIALNKLDLRTNTLHARIMNRLVADGKIAGSISGTPE